MIFFPCLKWMYALTENGSCLPFSSSFFAAAAFYLYGSVRCFGTEGGLVGKEEEEGLVAALALCQAQKALPASLSLSLW